MIEDVIMCEMAGRGTECPGEGCRIASRMEAREGGDDLASVYDSPPEPRGEGTPKRSES